MVLITQVAVNISVYQYTVRKASQTLQRIAVDPEENLDFQHHYKTHINSKTFIRMLRAWGLPNPYDDWVFYDMEVAFQLAIFYLSLPFNCKPPNLQEVRQP